MDFTNPLTMHTDVQDLFGGMVAARKTLTDGGFTGEEAFALVGGVFSGVVSAKIHQEVHHPALRTEGGGLPAGIPPEIAKIFSEVQDVAGEKNVSFIDLSRLQNGDFDDLLRHIRSTRPEQDSEQ